MITKTKLQPMRESKVRALLNVVPDWAFVSDDTSSIHLTWTTSRGLWRIHIQFPFIGGDRASMKVTGKGLELNFQNFDDDDLSGIIALLSSQGAVKVKEEE